MKKFIIIFLLIFIAAVFLQTKELDLKFRFAIDGKYKPYFYVPSFQMNSAGFDVSFMSGVTLNKITVALEVNNIYHTMNGTENNLNTNGAINLLRFTLNGYFHLIKWFEFDLGAGGAWMQSSFQRESNYWQVFTHPSLSFLLDLHFYFPWKYIEFKVINRVDLLLVYNKDNTFNSFQPLYMGGGRIILHPYITWMDFYLEALAMPLYYENDAVAFGDIICVWGAGISIDLSFNLKPKKEKTGDKENETSDFKEKFEKQKEEREEARLERERIRKEKEEQERLEKEAGEKERAEQERIKKEKEEEERLQKEKTEAEKAAKEKAEQEKAEREKAEKEKAELEKKIKNKNLLKLNRSKPGDIIDFSEIRFEIKTDNFTSDSYEILDMMAEIIQDNDFSVIFTGYSEFLGNPLFELELAEKRVKAIIDYLVNKGVPRGRLKSKTTCTIYNPNNKSSKPKTIVEILQP